jgi:two-component system response regulator YesN
MYKVMLVDDSEMALQKMKQLKTWKERSNFIICSEARDGEEALLKLADAPVDLVITDIRMPKMNGFELLTKAIEMGLARAVALFSAHRNFEYARKALVLGAFDYLVKPVGEADLAKLLNRAARYLEEMDAREKRLRELEANRICKYLDIEIELLIAGIVTGKAAVEDNCRNLVRVVRHLIGLRQLRFQVRRILMEIRFALQERFPWLEKFVDLNWLLEVDDAMLDNGKRVEDFFAAILGSLTRTIHKLNLGNGSNAIVEKTCDYILRNIDQAITVKSLSQSLFLHRSYLSEVFREQTGQRLNDYLTMIKLERAKKLLEDGELLCYQIAMQLGYRDTDYFSRIFKNYTGFLPSQYKSFGGFLR